MATKASTRTTDPTVAKQRAIQTYLDAKADGKSNTEARQLADKVTKVNFSHLQLRWYGDPRNPNGVQPDPAWASLDEEARAAQVTVWRNDGRSWGEIMILGDWMSEGKARTYFEVGSKLSSIGHRTGHGGRFAFGDPRLYTGNHKGLGTELTRAELKELRDDPEKLEAYMAASAEYASKLGTKAKAAAKRIKA